MRHCNVLLLLWMNGRRVSCTLSIFVSLDIYIFTKPLTHGTVADKVGRGARLPAVLRVADAGDDHQPVVQRLVARPVQLQLDGRAGRDGLSALRAHPGRRLHQVRARSGDVTHHGRRTSPRACAASPDRQSLP